MLLRLAYLGVTNTFALLRRPVRCCPSRRRHRHRAHRHPNAQNELNHPALGTDLPPRTPRPHPDLAPATPTPRAPRVRTLLQLPPATSGHRQRPTAAPITTADHRFGPDHPPRHPPTPTPERHHQRVPAHCLTCADEIFGKHRTAVAAYATSGGAQEAWEVLITDHLPGKLGSPLWIH
jgi:hypothetical protein